MKNTKSSSATLEQRARWGAEQSRFTLLECKAGAEALHLEHRFLPHSKAIVDFLTNVVNYWWEGELKGKRLPRSEEILQTVGMLNAYLVETKGKIESETKTATSVASPLSL